MARQYNRNTCERRVEHNFLIMPDKRRPDFIERFFGSFFRNLGRVMMSDDDLQLLRMFEKEEQNCKEEIERMCARPNMTA